MAKSGPKTAVSDSMIAAKITAGRSDRDIARALHVGRDRVAKVRRLGTGAEVIKAEPVPDLDRIKAAVRLELNQEETRNEFSDQLHEYTKNYKDAMRIGDTESAGKWSVLRVQLLKEMIKISGIDRMRIEAGPSAQNALSDMSDEEVERRAREIIAKRQR